MDNLATVRSAITLISSRKELAINTARTEMLKQYAHKLSVIVDKEENQKIFAEFSVNLIDTLNSTLEMKEPAIVQKLKENIWIEYAAIRANKLPELWNNFLASINCSNLGNDPLLTELVNEQIFEGLLEKVFKIYDSKPTSTIASVRIGTNFSKDEENVIRYACGYVVRKLMQKFLNQKNNEIKGAAFVESLSRMRADHEDNASLTSFLEYTRDWIATVNRGGLYEVNDDVYLLMKEIEATMQGELVYHLKRSTIMSEGSTKEKITNLVLQSSNVSFYWDILTGDIHNEEWRTELLTHIIALWLTIRGFSISMEWMEEYKCIMGMDNKKKKGLRKELKQMSSI